MLQVNDHSYLKQRYPSLYIAFQTKLCFLSVQRKGAMRHFVLLLGKQSYEWVQFNQ